MEFIINNLTHAFNEVKKINNLKKAHLIYWNIADNWFVVES